MIATAMPADTMTLVSLVLLAVMFAAPILLLMIWCKLNQIHQTLVRQHSDFSVWAGAVCRTQQAPPQPEAVPGSVAAGSRPSCALMRRRYPA